MANKSNLNVVIDNGLGVQLNIVADASGYLNLSINDGKNTVNIALGATDASVLRAAISYAVGLRQQIPQSV